MNNTIGESIALAKAIKEGTTNIKNGEVVIAPPFTSLYSVGETIKGSNVSLAAQNMYYEDKGRIHRRNCAGHAERYRMHLCNYRPFGTPEIFS